MAKVVKEYAAGSLKQLGDLEHIRVKPGMYLGSCQTPWHALKEVFDNAIDEHGAGHVSTIYVRYDRKTHELFVADDGRGIPVEKHPQLKIPTIIAVFTKQRFGGKFTREGGAYVASIGTHGIGTKATNALASEFEVWTHREGKWWHVLFKDGKETKKVVDKVGKPPFTEAPFNKAGTQVRVKPDKQFFDTLDIDIELLKERCADVAYLCPGLKIILDVGKRKVYQTKSGLPDLISGMIAAEAQTQTIKTLHKEPFYFREIGKDGTGVECCLQWTNGDDVQVYTYVNVSDTPEHGLHYDGLIDAIMDVVGGYSKKSQDFDPEDLMTGLFGAIHLLHKDPGFKSQTKDKLIKPKEIKHEVFSALVGPIKKFFRKNRELVDELIEKACEMKKARTSFKDKKKALRGLELKKNARGFLPGKALTAPNCKPENRELFICEGDSAKGSAGSARDSTYQEVLPLKGKIVNSMKKDDAATLGNTEVQAIIQMVGTDIRDKCDPAKARVGKVMLMADADADGSHITSLLISFFAEYYRPLLEVGMVYVVAAPLFKASAGDKHAYGKTLKEVRKKMKKMGVRKFNCTRFKGLGESDPEELKEYGMDPATRKLKKVVLRGNKDIVLLREIMGDSTEKRREILGLEAAAA
jgi:DNA gyrase/topoisomerase IV subunit B